LDKHEPFKHSLRAVGSLSTSADLASRFRPFGEALGKFRTPHGLVASVAIGNENKLRGETHLGLERGAARGAYIAIVRGVRRTR